MTSHEYFNGFTTRKMKCLNGFFIITLNLFILGCSHQLQFDKTDLAPAFYGKSYSEVIQIEDIEILDTRIKTNLPSNSGLNITITGTSEFFSNNIITVKGIPKVKGNYDIKIYGEFRGGAMGQVIDFKKKYKLSIQ